MPLVTASSGSEQASRRSNVNGPYQLSKSEMRNHPSNI